MKSSNDNGFTIIEVLLFLSITGLLVAGVLASTGGTINSQRYLDSIASLKSKIQMQYADVTNVSNSRSSDLTCNSSAIISVGGATSPPIGQSDCVILGKALQLNATKDNLLIKDVIGYPDSTALDNAKNDLEVFRAYGIKVPTEAHWPANTYNIEWGSSISKVLRPPTESMTPSDNFTVLILRSPSSGVTHTYIDTNTSWSDANLFSMIADTNKENLNSYIDMCVDSNGLIAANRKKMAVRIYSIATSSSGVETIGDAMSACP